MENVKPNISETNLANGLISVGIFVVAFYFVFLRGTSLFGQGNNQKNNPTLGSTTVDMTPYIGSKKYFGQEGNADDFVKGFDMPQNMDDINWGSESDVWIITKPNSQLLFDNVQPKSLIKVWRVGDSKLGYSKSNSHSIVTEDYDSIKADIILVKNTDLKNK